MIIIKTNIKEEEIIGIFYHLVGGAKVRLPNEFISV